MLTTTDKKNAVWNSLGFIGVALLGFVNFSLNYITFPSAEFGVFIFINSIFGIGNTLDFGFGVSTVKLISENRKKDDLETVRKIFATYFAGYLILGVLILVGFWIYYALFLNHSSLVGSVSSRQILLIFSFLSVSFLFRYINNYLNRVYEGFAEFVLYSKISIVTALFNTSLMLLLFILKFGLEYLAFIYFLSGFVNFISLMFFLLRRVKTVRLDFRKISFSIIKKYAVYSINIQLSFFVNSFVDPLIKYFIGSYLSMSFVTYFESAKKIIDMTNGLIFSAQKGVLNKISEHNAVGKLTEYINSELSTYSKMSNYYSVFLYGILNTFLCGFIYFWFKSYEGMLMFLIFIIPYSLINFAGCLYLVLMVEGKGKKLLFLQGINFVFVLGFLFLTLNIFHNYFGLLGYYISVAITIILMFYFLGKYNGLEIKKFLSNVEFFSLIKLNLLILVEIALLILFKEYFIYLLVSFTVVYCIVFFKFLKYFTKFILEKYKSVLSYF